MGDHASQLIGVKEASEILRVSRQDVLHQVEQGLLSAQVVRDKLLLNRCEVEAKTRYTPKVRKNHFICLANQKGGVGKTTTAINLAAALSYRGRRVLVIDCDPQANLTQTLLRDTDLPKWSTYNIFEDTPPAPDDLICSIREGLDLIPSSIELSKAERLINDFGRFYALSDFCDGFRGAYDYTIIDTPPSLSICTTAALLSTDSVIIPIQLNIFSLQGLHDLLHTIKELSRRNARLNVLGFLGCFYDSRNRLCDQVLSQVKQIGAMMETLIRRNVRLEEHPAYNEDIFLYDRESRGSQDYSQLAQELINRVELPTHPEQQDLS